VQTLQAIHLNSTIPDESDPSVAFAWSGSSYHMITELRADGVRAVSVKPWGQSDDPSSPHFADLTEVYANSQHKPFWFTRSEVEANLESRTELHDTP
jgi:acyl-homoserine lactone acylase PvdQ